MDINYAMQIMFYIKAQDCSEDGQFKTQLCNTCKSSQTKHSPILYLTVSNTKDTVQATETLLNR